MTSQFLRKQRSQLFFAQSSQAMSIFSTSNLIFPLSSKKNQAKLQLIVLFLVIGFGFNPKTKTSQSVNQPTDLITEYRRTTKSRVVHLRRVLWFNQWHVALTFEQWWWFLASCHQLRWAIVIGCRLLVSLWCRW